MAYIQVTSQDQVPNPRHAEYNFAVRSDGWGSWIIVPDAPQGWISNDPQYPYYLIPESEYAIYSIPGACDVGKVPYYLNGAWTCRPKGSVPSPTVPPGGKTTDAPSNQDPFNTAMEWIMAPSPTECAAWLKKHTDKTKCPDRIVPSVPNWVWVLGFGALYMKKKKG